MMGAWFGQNRHGQAEGETRDLVRETPLSCTQLQGLFSLYLYGELPFADEDRLEQHLADCDFCQLAFRREKNWHAAVHAGDGDVPFSLLAECRQSLRQGIEQEAQTRHPRTERPRSWTNWWPAIPGFSFQLAGVSFLLLSGFFFGRWTERSGWLGLAGSAGFSEMGLLGSHREIRDVRRDRDGQIRIIVDQVSERALVGRLQDESVRRMVLAATQVPVNPALRVDSISVLAGQDTPDVRDAFIRSVRMDPNAAVRLKALQGLRAFAAEPVTRRVLLGVLERDTDGGVRAEAIDVLAPASQQSEDVSPDVVRAAQRIMEGERDDSYVGLRCLQILRSVSGPQDMH